MIRIFFTLWSVVLITLMPTLAATVTADFTSAGSIPVTVSAYNATDNDVTISIAFAPPMGTNLTVVNNTGLPFISGQFSNLAQGQTVNLSYSGISYKFVANYYGGSGNDLVLHWASQGLAAWGRDFEGQLGDSNSLVGSAIPVMVSQSGVLASKTIIATSAGGDHTLALCSDGTLASWGLNNYGQLGNGTRNASSLPVLVTQTGVLAGKTIIAISAGREHSLALCSDGALAAWGRNEGRLGDGSRSDSDLPILVTQNGVLAGKTIVAISAGSLHSLALCSDGTLATWGDDIFGQLGNDSLSYPNSSVPVLVTQSGILAGKTIIAISAGDTHSLALCSDGTLAAWGNKDGQLGVVVTTSSSVPVQIDQSRVLSGKTITAISAGGFHNLALCSDGTLVSWGDNTFGQLGNASTTNSSAPVLVTRSGYLANRTIISISAGQLHSLAVCSDGTLVAWGRNSSGELGNNESTDSSTPILVNQSGVIAGKKVVSITAGNAHSIVQVIAQNNCDLSGLFTGIGTLNPAFSATSTTYTASVSNLTTSLTVIPFSADPAAKIAVNGAAVLSGSSSASIPLAVGDNTITVMVTAQDGITVKTYSLKVTRAASSVATLKGLSVKGIALNPNFKSAKTAYTASVGRATSSIRLTATATHPDATIRVNGATIKSGSLSKSIALKVGKNTIKIIVRAQDGTAKIYKIVVTRLSAAVS